MRVRAMLISDVVEELDLVARREEARGDRVYGRVAPALWIISLYVVSAGDKRTS